MTATVAFRQTLLEAWGRACRERSTSFSGRSSAGERFPDCGVCSLAIEEVGVDLERRGRILVAEHGGDCDGIKPGSDETRRCGVSKIMEGEMGWEPGEIVCWFEPSAGDVPVPERGSRD